VPPITPSKRGVTPRAINGRRWRPPLRASIWNREAVDYRLLFRYTLPFMVRMTTWSPPPLATPRIVFLGEPWQSPTRPTRSDRSENHRKSSNCGCCGIRTLGTQYPYDSSGGSWSCRTPEKRFAPNAVPPLMTATSVISQASCGTTTSPRIGGAFFRSSSAPAISSSATPAARRGLETVMHASAGIAERLLCRLDRGDPAGASRLRVRCCGQGSHQSQCNNARSGTHPRQSRSNLEGTLPEGPRSCRDQHAVNSRAGLDRRVRRTQRSP